MKRITILEFEQKLKEAKAVRPAGTTKQGNDTRHGYYVSLQYGMTKSELWFHGLDLSENTTIIELVG